MSGQHFTAEIAHHIWDSKYRYRDDAQIFDQTIEDSWRRIARALASVERESKRWEAE